MCVCVCVSHNGNMHDKLFSIQPYDRAYTASYLFKIMILTNQQCLLNVMYQLM